MTTSESDAPQTAPAVAGCTAARPRSIDPLIPRSENSAATRTAFLIALAFDEPCVMMHAPFTPSKGAPPYSVWSSRFLKSVNALRESNAPTCRVIVALSDSLSVVRTRLATPSEILRATLPTNPSATITSTLPLYKSAFHIAHKVQWQLFQQKERFAREFVALAFFFADREQSHAWSRRPGALAKHFSKPISKHGSKINVAHYGKLFEILRRAVDIRADVEQHRGIAWSSGKNRAQSRTIHARNRAQHDFRRSHGRAGVAGGNESCRLSLAHHSQANAHGGIALGANRLHFIFHGDDFAGVNDFNGQARGRRVAIQFRLDHFFRADQQHPHAILTRRENGALNLRLGSAVRTHRIQRDHARHGGNR